MIDETDLPDELQGRVHERPQPADDNGERLARLGLTVAGKRDEAIRARKASGIEDVWMGCEQAYICMDEANQHEFAGAKWAKPTSMDGPVSTNNNARIDETKSTAFIPLTPRYVDAATAMVCEIILPIDGKAFSFAPTPVPDLIAQTEDTRQVVDVAPEDGGTGQPLTRPVAPGEQPPDAAAMPGQEAGPAPRVPLTVKDLAHEKMEAARKCSDKAEQRVFDWMVEAHYPMQMRKVVFDSERIGVGVLKGPFPALRKKRAITRANDAVALQFEFKTAPDCKWIDPWNFFPDGSCAEDVHDGDYVLERDFISASKLRDLKKERDSQGRLIYLSDQIDQVLAEGPDKANLENGNPNKDAKGKNVPYTLWYFYGRLSRDDLLAAGAKGMEELPDDLVEADAIITLVNDTAIRTTLNPLDSGSFPYRVLPGSRRAGHWAGRGTGEKVNIAQVIVNNATRRMLENAGKSAGCQFVIDQDVLIPGDKQWTITPDKIWLKKPDATMDDVRKAFMSVAIQNVGDQLQKIIDYGFKIAEEASSIPLIAQGQDGQTTPQTFGQAELQNNNAHTMMRAKAYAVDDCITEPLVNDLYDWLLMDPSVPNDEKGDFDIDAHGSIVMVEKAVQEQFQLQMGGMVKDPAFGINPKLWIAEVYKSKRLDIGKVQYTEQEQAKLESQPPPEAPQVTAAKIRAQSDTQKTQITQQAAVARMKVDTDRDTAFVQAEAQRNANLHEATMAELNVRRELAMLDYANKRNISLDQLKAEMAQTAMKLNVQKELSALDAGIDLHKHHNPSTEAITPPTEPAGRAEDGKAWTQ